MSAGKTGVAVAYGDTSFFTSRNNRFAANRYSLPALDGRYFAWNNTYLTKDQWQAAGQDSAGEFTRL